LRTEAKVDPAGAPITTTKYLSLPASVLTFLKLNKSDDQSSVITRIASAAANATATCDDCMKAMRAPLIHADANYSKK